MVRIVLRPGIGTWFDVLCFPSCVAAFVASAVQRGKLELGLSLAAAMLPLCVLAVLQVRRQLFGTRVDFLSSQRVRVRNGFGRVLAEGTADALGFFIGERSGTTYLCWPLCGGIAAPLKDAEVRELRALRMEPQGGGVPRPMAATRPYRALILAVSIGGVSYMDWSIRQQAVQVTPGQRVSGMFWYAKAHNPSAGFESRACYSGRNQGNFKGVALALSDSLELVQFEEHRSPDAVVRLQFRDKNHTAIGVPERECVSVTGDTRVRSVRARGRDLAFLEGEIRIDCPALGLKGGAKFRGCLPYGY